MARILCLAVAITLSVIAPKAAIAGDFFQQVNRGYHQNRCWYRPYIYPDRDAVAAPFAIMINNGWRRQNLLGDHHFEADNSRLTTAGALKVNWILTQAPVNRRSIFVQQTWEQEKSAMRLQVVQLAASKLLPMGEVADVRSTNLQIEGRSADIVDVVNTRFRESMPVPILPAATSDSGEE